MQFVAIVRSPDRPDVAAHCLSAACGLTLAEARMRLAPEPPVLLGRLDTAAADALVATLRGDGIAAMAVDTHCPSDRDRVLAHHFSLGDGWATFTPRAGDALKVPWSEVVAILRAVRAARTEIERTERLPRYHFSSGEPSIDQGPTITSRTVSDSLEHVILVYARDGRCALLSEMELAFTDLGSAMQPSGAANLTLLAGQLRERARSAFFDERLVRLGRRPLPFMVDAESRLATERYSRTRTDTAATLDVLAEVMRRALLAGLLP